MNNDVTPRRAGARVRPGRALAASIVFALLAYLVLAGLQNGDQAWHAAVHLGAGGVTLVLGLSLANYLVRCWRWRIYLRALGYRLPAGLALRYYVAGFGFTTTPGKVGEAVRSLYLKRHAVPYADSLSLFVSERLADIGAMLALSVLALSHFPAFTGPLVLVLLAAVTLLVAIRRRGVRTWLLARVAHRSGRLARLTERGVALLAAAARLTRPYLLGLGLVSGLVAWGAEGVAFYYILQFLGVEAPFWTSIGIYSLSVLIGAVSFLPGGLGSTEAAMVLLLLLAGADQGTAVAATLVCRVATLWFAVLLGGIAMLTIRPAPAEPTIEA